MWVCHNNLQVVSFLFSFDHIQEGVAFETQSGRCQSELMPQGSEAWFQKPYGGNQKGLSLLRGPSKRIWGPSKQISALLVAFLSANTRTSAAPPPKEKTPRPRAGLLACRWARLTRAPATGCGEQIQRCLAKEGKPMCPKCCDPHEFGWLSFFHVNQPKKDSTPTKRQEKTHPILVSKNETRRFACNGPLLRLFRLERRGCLHQTRRMLLAKGLPLSRQ